MIYLMDTERDLDKGSGVAADIPFFRVESAEQERLAVDEFNEQRINGSNGVSDGRIGGREGLMMRTGSEEARVYPELDSGELQSRNEVRVSEEGLPGLHFNRENDDSAAANVETEKGGSYGTGVSSEITSKEADGDNGATVSDVKSEGLSGNVNNDVFAVQNSGVKDLTTKADVGPVVASGETKWDPMAIKEQIVSDFNSQYTMFNAGQMPEALGAETLKASGCGLEMGDMVWGKVKSHPWWPGHIYTEAFASPSVRRTRREGHVLVAFFGDSSYGWFDPSELIPFDPHYAEKSRQTSSRNFVKAAEESVDEASRRSALGLTCRCRNPFNFRPTKVRGYFAVDVDGFEPGGIYSLKQIKQARDSFRPAETLSFIQQLAVTPRNGDHTSIAWIKNIAAVFAYRKAVFEEFDETYAQAFGVQPVRPSRDIMALWEQYAKVPSRAPLSGPLVIAEALGERKISTKPGKIKEQSKKDKYLFKRRDEPTDHRAHHIDHSQLSLRAPSTYKEGPAVLAAGDYVLQRRPAALSTKSQIPMKQEGVVSNEGTTLSQGVDGKEAVSIDRKSVVTSSSLADAQANVDQNGSWARFSFGFSMTQSPVCIGNFVAQGPGDAKPHHSEDIGATQDMKAKLGLDPPVVPMIVGDYGSDFFGKSESTGARDGLNQLLQKEGEAMLDPNRDESAELVNTSKGLVQPKPTQTMRAGDLWGLDKVLDYGSGTHPLPHNVNVSGKVVEAGIDSVIKKEKVLKHPTDYLDPKKLSLGEKKRKKKKKEPNLEKKLDHPPKRLKIAKDKESVRKSVGKSVSIGLVSRETSQVDQERKGDGAGCSFGLDSVATPPIVDTGNIEVELPQLVGDLLALALDPFHGLEWNSPAMVRQVFLRFRSLVYQKSLVLSPPSDAEPCEASAGMPVAVTGVAETLPSVDMKDVPTTPKPQKQIHRPDDPTRSGRKRSISDRQEEKSAKRMKKLSELKSLATEKKAGKGKSPETQSGEQKESGVIAPTKNIKPKPNSVKKLELAPRVAEPAMLVMKFPPRTSLPSPAELKARFARFGPLDHSGTRQFWKSSTCRVVFKNKSHAQAALDYAVRNNSLFGNMKVRFHLRDMEVSESGRGQAEDTSDEALLVRSQGASDLADEGRPGSVEQRSLQSSIQLKSCLKKPSGDESGMAVGVPRESPRVKFMLSGEESSGGGHVVGSSSNNINNNGGNADSGASSSSPSPSSLAMDVNSKNFQKVIPQHQMVHIRPLNIDVHENHGVAHFSKAHHHMHFSEVESNNMDISHQMLSLLMRCSDIVADVKCSLGYVPYHPI